MTNDGATILKSIGVDNPAAKVLVGKTHIHSCIQWYVLHSDSSSLSDATPSDISMVQDDEVGDGTTSVTVLACELLKVVC